MKTTSLARPKRPSARAPASLLAFWALLALLALSPLSWASVNPKLQLIGYEMSEAPAQPGHTLALTLHLKSLESDNCAERVAVQLAVAYPLSVQGPDTQYVESLCYRDPDSMGTFTFLLPVDNLAATGTYPVQVSTTYEKRFTKLSESNTVNVRVGGSPSFSASVASSNPVDIYPGDSAQVAVAFQNTGPSLVQSARAHASSSGIQVKWSGQDQALGTIPARSTSTASFAIEAPKDLAPGTYPLDIRLDYSGEDRQNGSILFHFSVPVKPKAEFRASYGSERTLHAGASQEAVLSLTNTGRQEARALKVRIQPLFPFSTDGTVRYIESLPPGRTANLTYAITVDKDATAGAQLVGLMVDFEDPQGKKLSDTAEFALPVRLSTPQEMVEPYLPFLYLAALVLALVLVRRLVAMVSGPRGPQK